MSFSDLFEMLSDNQFSGLRSLGNKRIYRHLNRLEGMDNS